MKHVKLHKPNLAEILSSFGGISCAAIAVTIHEDQINKLSIDKAKKGRSETLLKNDWPHHPLCVLEAGFADIRYNSRHSLIKGADDVEQQSLQDTLAVKLLSALDSALPVLKAHEDVELTRYARKFGQKELMVYRGGTVKDVVAHIESMMERERSGEPRELIHSNNVGAITPVYTPSYMPKGEKVPRGRDTEESGVEIDQFMQNIQAELRLQV